MANSPFQEGGDRRLPNANNGGGEGVYVNYSFK